MSWLKKILQGLETKYKAASVASPFSMIGEVVMETVLPLIMARIIDVGIANHDINYVCKLGLIMTGCSLLSLSFGVLGARLSAVGALGFSRNLRRKLFEKVQSFSFGNIDKFSTSSLVTRLTTDVTNAQNAYQMVIRGLVRAPFMLVSGTFMAIKLNAKLSLIFITVIPILAVCLAFISIKAHPRFKAMLGQYDKMNSIVQENLTAIRVVKSFVRVPFEDKKFEDASAAVRDTQVKAERIIILNLPLMQFVVYGCIIAGLWFGGNFIVEGKMQTGELISFITYITQILMSLMMLSMMLVMLIISRASISRIVEVLDEESEIKNPAVPVKNVADGSVEFKNVFFSYNHQKSNCVLENINLRLESGKTYGIIGGTGSSKSTLVSLIARLYDTLEGSVTVGGVDVKDYDLEVLRDSVSMVLQKNVLFSGTIKENLKWGNSNATDEEIRTACIASDAHEFVESFPKGYDTDLGQGGVNLSGGQKQRLCIARALLKKPKILVLDDSTSAVDTATDSRIRSALKNCLPQTTKLIIAQRINSVQDADQIIVLDNGKISGTGTHAQLMENNSIYREVYESQLAGSGQEAD